MNKLMVRLTTLCTALMFMLPFATELSAQGVERTWSQAKIHVPAALTRDGRACNGVVGTGTCQSRIKPGRFPVLVFLHGSAPTQTGAFFHNLGTVVVYPDSYARPGRFSGEQAFREEKVPFVNMRTEEAAYAASQLGGQPWADTSKLILAGHSEGGIATAVYSSGGYKARIIMSWVCGGQGWQTLSGIRGGGPILALAGGADPIFNRLGQGRGCASHVGWGNQHIVVPNAGHHLWNQPIAKQAVAQFVQAQ
ncbi:MAG: hypothetical protein EOO23_03625 [Comamonadaceae bacterium]|nr:MAG: hypothetical protein EOO23_03625 [Comamonadaceae bacterium]